ncbi:MAG TPA: TRAP transporter small permease [Aminivibrio sp.]|nr:TRAP transporter small permease [Aminivibrio sp.]
MERNRSEARGETKRSPLLQLSDAVNTVSEVVLFGMILAMIAVTTLQIVCRIFFDALIWSEELTTYLLVASSLLGAAVGFKRGSHIAVTFLVNKLPETHRKAVSVFVQCLGVFFFAVVAYYGADLMKSEAMQTTPAMGISMTWIYVMYPVIGGIILLHLLAGFGDILGRR